MLYAAASRRSSVLRRQSVKRSFSTNDQPGSVARNTRDSRVNSALLLRRPTTANNFRRARPSTPYKSKDVDRVKELEAIFLLTEQEVFAFYRAFCFMAKKAPMRKSARTTTSKKSKKGIGSEPPSGMTIELNSTSSSNANRPWESKNSKVTLSLKAFFSVFDLPSGNGGFYDALFELVGVKNFHSMTFK